ncbi:hypothetical protein PZU33_32975, partial [Pseudomonas aeruginosa]|nr:hypothetical protein [Pseudomonas aeruginosa]MEA8694274.1 hypothetical protein [Pseudomonas aeruginosa]
MSSTQHQLIEQCATRLRGIVDALDNIHDTSPHRWSTDLDDVHSSAESLLALIKDQAPAPCIDCKGTGFCNSISGEEIRCPCHAPIQFADPAQTPVEQFEQAPPSEDQLTAAGLSYPLAKEDAVKLWYAGFRSEVVTVLEAWEAIGHDIGMNPSKGELLDSLRNMAAICDAHGNDMPAQSAIDQRQVIADAITGALAFGAQASQPPAEDHWLRPFYDIGRAEGQRTQELAMLVRMLASSLKRHAPESNLMARATNYLAAKGLAGTPLRDAPASVEQAGGDERDLQGAQGERQAFEAHESRERRLSPADQKFWFRRGAVADYDIKSIDDAWKAWKARAALAQPALQCKKCGGTGDADSGGIHPWGEAAMVPCDCAHTERAQGKRTEDGDTIIDRLRLGGLTIDGDNAYKRDLLDCVVGALAFGFQGRPAPEETHWLHRFWEIGNAEREARAALAQPSPAQAEQAEVERPEVVGYLSITGARLLREWGVTSIRREEFTPEACEPLMTVAQHERITAQLHDALDESDGDRWKLRSERDAALARVSEL